MEEYLWLLIALPLAGFGLLSLAGGRLPARLVGGIGAGVVGLAALLAILVALDFGRHPEPAGVGQTLWSWIPAATFSAAVSLRLDALSLVMLLVVTGVGFLILLYSVEFMAGQRGYSRFFAAMDLFVASMLILVLADDLLLLYLGWEGVGLCSYLLIGFWYRDPANVAAARKAFLVTRIGDVALLIGLLLLFSATGSLAIPAVLQAVGGWPAGAPLATLAAALLLAGALGKSAQLPLQVWLPDAMAGPTPVSALIHAATMVTAGVYLIARTHALFLHAPLVLAAVAIIGAATLLLAALAALAQTDIKRVLAYSTISQIGYMFLALGVGAFGAAIFHLMVHAFFKALLFLAAGVVIHCLHHEHDLRKMGGLWRELPTAFWPFLIGAAALAALPLVSSGFYSKDLILLHAWSWPHGGPWLWLAGLLGAFLTALYAGRLLILCFLGPLGDQPEKGPGRLMTAPLYVLAFFSLFAGFVQTPRPLLGIELFGRALAPVFPAPAAEAVGLPLQIGLLLLTSVASLSGLWLARTLYLARPQLLETLSARPGFQSARRFLAGGLGFDRLYGLLLVKPFRLLSRLSRADVLLLYAEGLGLLCRLLHRGLSATQSGNTRWYAAGVALGAVILIALGVLP